MRNTVNNFHTNNNANAMTFELTQSEVDSLDHEDYSMFLAYGDTFRYSPPEPTGEGSDQFWEAEATRILAAASGEKLLVSKRLRSSLNQRMPTIRYQ